MFRSIWSLMKRAKQATAKFWHKLTTRDGSPLRNISSPSTERAGRSTPVAGSPVRTSSTRRVISPRQRRRMLHRCQRVNGFPRARNLTIRFPAKEPNGKKEAFDDDDFFGYEAGDFCTAKYSRDLYFPKHTEGLDAYPGDTNTSGCPAEEVMIFDMSL